MPERLKRQVCELVGKIEFARRGGAPAPGESLKKSVEKKRAERVDDKALIKAYLKSGGSSRIKSVRNLLEQKTRIKENNQGFQGAVPHSHGRRYVEELLREIKKETI